MSVKWILWVMTHMEPSNPKNCPRHHPSMGSSQEEQTKAVLKCKRIKSKYMVAGAVTELTAGRSLFVCLLVIVQISAWYCSERDFGRKYEFSMVPRLMFECDGTMHMYQVKSTLCGLPKPEPSGQCDCPYATDAFWVAIIAGMAEIQALDKPETINTCRDLAENFIMRLQRNWWTDDKVHLRIDTYAEDSGENINRKKRFHGIALY